MIHILCADISSADSIVFTALYEAASPERRLRADSYLQEADKLRCVTADALLRVALGTDAFQVETGPWGKPFIRNRQDFHYNLSHSGRYVVLAWGSSPVGVDVQEHRPLARLEALAARFFTAEEQDFIRQSPQDRFYEVWSGKESYLKYLGTGLQKELNSFGLFALEPEVRWTHRRLPGGYSLSLCAAEPEVTFRLLDVKQLL